MNVALIAPPTSTPFAPPMSLLALRAYLTQEGIAATAIDANVEAIHYTLNPERCRQFITPALPTLRAGLPPQVAAALAPRRITDERHPALPPLDEARALHVLERLERLWTPEGFSLSGENYPEQLSILNDGLLLASWRMFPNCLSIWGQNPGQRLTSGGPENPFLHYCLESLLPRLEALEPEIIGLSLGHDDQTFYTLFLLDALRRKRLGKAIVVGGATFTLMCKSGVGAAMEAEIPADKASSVGVVRTIMASFTPMPAGRMDSGSPAVMGVYGEGETPLLEICRRVEASQPVADVPGIVYVDSQAGSVVFRPPAAPLASEALPMPDLAGLGIGKRYPTPLPMAPLMTSRGCYWDKCTFCDHARFLGPGFREFPVDRVADTLAEYRNTYGVEYVFMCDESLSPRMLGALTDALAQRDVFIRYGTMCRIEKEFVPLVAPAAKQGLSFMSVGFESGCDRVTECMNKGYTRSDAETMIDECYRQGVGLQCFTMLGFPTETAQEAQQTIDYLAAMSDRIWGISAACWGLTSGSYILTHPEEFGVTAAGPGPVTLADHVVSDGLTRPEAMAFLHRLKTHPKLERFFRIQGVEDYRIIVDLLCDGVPQAGKTREETP